MAPVYDFECEKGHITESIEHHSVDNIQCRRCRGRARKIITLNGPNCVNEDADWIRSVLDVVDKDSRARHVLEFRQNPTRENYRKWMKNEGLRHLEPGEERKPYPDAPDMSKARKEVWDKHVRRNRLEVRG